MSGTRELKDTKKVKGPWDKIRNNEPKQLRAPKSADSDLSIPDTNNETKKPEDVKNESTEIQNLPEIQNYKILNSTLNANAAEFIPLSNQNLNSINNSNQDDQYQDVVTYLKEELNYLTLNPGKYDDIVLLMEEVIQPYISNDSALGAFISVIIDVCVSEPNLRYNGARLCCDLTKKFGIQFRNVLLKRLQEEHTKFIENEFSNDGNFMHRIQGFAMFLAEMFLQTEVRYKKMSVLGVGLIELLPIILKNETEKGVKSVCQVLKLSGKKLEETKGCKSQLDELFSRLQSICNYVDLDPNLRFIVTSVLDMRASNWGESTVQQSPTQEIQQDSEFFNDPVFFGPDGKVITEEETSFLQESVPFSEDAEDYVCEQEMDEEVYNDFQKFLNMNRS